MIEIKIDQNTIQAQIEKINNVFTNSKFSDMKLNRTRTNDTLMDKIKGNVNAKSALSIKIHEAEESKKIEEKIELNLTMTITEDAKESSLIDFQEYKNLENIEKSEENESEANKIEKLNSLSNFNSGLRNSNSIDVIKFNSTDVLQKNIGNNNFNFNNTNNEYVSVSENDNNISNNLVFKNFAQSIDNLICVSSNKEFDNEKEKEEYEKTKSGVNEKKNLLGNNSNKKSKKISLIENFTKIKNKSINYNIKAADKSLKLTDSNKKQNENKQIDIVTPVVCNLNSKSNSLNKSPNNNFKNLNSLVMFTQETQLSTTENYGKKVSNFNTNANNSKTPKKLEMKTNGINVNNNVNNNNSLSNNKTKTQSGKINNIYNLNNINNNKNNLNQSNKKSLQVFDLSEKKDFLFYKKSSEAFLNNSKLSNEKETNLNNYKSNIIINSKNKSKTKNKNISITNNEENYNSIINEHYFPENTESEYLTYNKSMSSERDFKAFTNRQSAFDHKKKFNDSLLHEKIKKSNSKNKMNVIRLPKKPLNKNKNLKIVINPIYEFTNKNIFGAENRKNENIISMPNNKNNDNNKFNENPEKNKIEKTIEESNNISNLFNVYSSNNNVNSNNPLTATNAGKKPSLAVYDFSNEENLFSKKNKSHTPINRAAASGDSNSNTNNFNIKEIHTNQTYSDKNKASGFNFKKFNYIFGDGNSTTNKTKTSFFKSQTDFNTKKTDQNTTNTINNTNYKDNNNTINDNNNDNRISQKNIVANQYAIASKEMNNLIKKVQFEGDITNLKGLIKKIYI